MDNSERLFKFLQRCQKNHDKPDIHSFNINIAGGTAYVECRGYEVYIEHTVYGVDSEIKWAGSTIAAANRLDCLGADYATIDM